MPATRPILIAGGGIGGLALALALTKVGRACVVLERRERFATEGAGIQIGPNGVRVLQQLGIADALRPLVGVPESIDVHEGSSGRLLARLPLGPWIAHRHGAPYWVAHRGDLHGVLLAAVAADVRVSIRAGFEVSSLTQTADEVRVTSSAGETLIGSALVGADGLWSNVRAKLMPSAVPQFVGATATRAVIAADEAGRLNMPAVGLWLSRHAHVVHYPVRGGAQVAVVVIAVEDWRATDWDTEADRNVLLAQISGFDASLIKVLARVPAWRKWSLQRLASLPRWSNDRVALLGDAAHPMLPYLAQGGVLALEDALVFSQCLVVHAADEPSAFQAYETQRLRRATRVQAMSRRNGRIYHLAPPLSWARDAILRWVPGAWLMSGYDWLYGWQPGAE
ncbi:MAG: FAD-binding monooxygenase [Hyphomicrobiaceae bacterium]|nr:MAG: FAD-binding monooxygenase [Hyphomicrobiaceae bacterium]